MPNFDAGAKEPVTFDFTKYVPGAVGEIPEPSSQQVEDFTAVLRILMPTTEDGTKIDVSALSAKVEEGLEVEKTLNEAIAALCSGTPTADQISRLPARLKSSFYGFIVGTYLVPEE